MTTFSERSLEAYTDEELHGFLDGLSIRHDKLRAHSARYNDEVRGVLSQPGTSSAERLRRADGLELRRDTATKVADAAATRIATIEIELQLRIG